MCEQERMELHHEPKPGYPKAFLITIIIAVIYLFIIFFTPLFHVSGH